MFNLSFKRYCPGCHSGEDIHRSKRRGILEKCVLPFFLARPFRCMSCGARYIGLFFAL
jgi:hypothetical protein